MRNVEKQKGGSLCFLHISLNRVNCCCKNASKEVMHHLKKEVAFSQVLLVVRLDTLPNEGQGVVVSN